MEWFRIKAQHEPLQAPVPPRNRRDDLATIHYDLYKDVNGIRPRWMDYDSMTEQQLEKEIALLHEEQDVQIEQQKIDEQNAIKAFESRVQDLVNSGAGDRQKAIEWISQAEGWPIGEHLAYELGLPFDYFSRLPATSP